MNSTIKKLVFSDLFGNLVWVITLGLAAHVGWQNGNIISAIFLTLMALITIITSITLQINRSKLKEERKNRLDERSKSLDERSKSLTGRSESLDELFETIKKRSENLDKFSKLLLDKDKASFEQFRLWLEQTASNDNHPEEGWVEILEEH